MTGKYQWSLLVSMSNILCVLNPARQNVWQSLSSLPAISRSLPDMYTTWKISEFEAQAIRLHEIFTNYNIREQENYVNVISCRRKFAVLQYFRSLVDKLYCFLKVKTIQNKNSDKFSSTSHKVVLQGSPMVVFVELWTGVSKKTLHWGRFSFSESALWEEHLSIGWVHGMYLQKQTNALLAPVSPVSMMVRKRRQGVLLVIALVWGWPWLKLPETALVSHRRRVINVVTCLVQRLIIIVIV